MVVFGLHLKVVKTRIHIGPDAQLLATRMPVLVNDVHVVVGRVKVGRVVAGDALTVNFLRTIVVMGKHQQAAQLIDRRDKLGVGTVHQLDAAHLVERNWMICPDDALHRTAKVLI